jgi:AcrR family transcriptional regulator
MNDLKRGTAKTRDRLIKGAIAVLATEGITGATTREIALVAGVSEVTLFRHFQNKEQLLGAVAQHIFNCHNLPFLLKSYSVNIIAVG